MDRDDRQLVALAKKGDRAAFRELVEAHSARVYRVAWRILGDAARAEDVVQETFIKVYEALPGFDGRARFTTWLHRVAVNAALDVRRREARFAVVDGGSEAAPVADDGPGPEGIAHFEDAGRAVAAALATLSDSERAAFALRHFEGRSTDEIAAALEVAPGAAKHTVFRAVRKLREALRPWVETSEIA